MPQEISEAELKAEDAIWAEALSRHAGEFATLKAQAWEDVKAGKSLPMFDERGDWRRIGRHDDYDQRLR
jgi:hypothetical protein